MPLFFNNTIPSAPTSRTTLAWAFRFSSEHIGTQQGFSHLWPAPLKLWVFTTYSNIRRTLALSTSIERSPFLTAARMSSNCLGEPGCSMSLPACMAATALSPPPQSLTYIPFQPHSSRTMVVSSSWFCTAYGPFSLL